MTRFLLEGLWSPVSSESEMYLTGLRDCFASGDTSAACMFRSDSRNTFSAQTCIDSVNSQTQCQKKMDEQLMLFVSMISGFCAFACFLGVLVLVIA